MSDIFRSVSIKLRNNYENDIIIIRYSLGFCLFLESKDDRIITYYKNAKCAKTNINNDWKFIARRCVFTCAISM